MLDRSPETIILKPNDIPEYQQVIAKQGGREKTNRNVKTTILIKQSSEVMKVYETCILAEAANYTETMSASKTDYHPL